MGIKVLEKLIPARQAEKEKKMTFLYDKTGNAVALIQSDVVYSISGKAVAFLIGTNVYSYQGKQLGTLQFGWLRDLKGCCVCYMHGCGGGGPLVPVTNIDPVVGILEKAPIKPIPEIPHIPAIPQLSWSSLSAKKFFNQR